MLEYYLIIAVIAAALSGLATYVWATSKSKRVMPAKSKAAVGPSPSQPVPTPNPAPPLGLIVPGASHVPLSMVTFLRLFGLAYAPLRDFCFIQGPLTKEQLHPVVAKSLVQMHSEGDAVGPDVMEFLFHGRQLQKTEMLSFVLLDGRPPQEGRIVAFVDKMRFPVKPRVSPT